MSSRLITTVLCLCLAAAACAGPDDTEQADATATGPETATADPTDATTPVASLAVYDDAAELAPAAAAEDFGPAGDGDPVAIGDTVRTDGTGFAQLDFVDGSLARLDSDTSLTVAALGETAAPVVELELDVGRVWNNVRDLGEDGSYEITTDVGTAAVRGTVFMVWVREDGSTLVAVHDGEVAFTTTEGEEFLLGPGDSLELGADGATDGAAPVPDTLAADPFVLRNQAIDSGGEDPGRGIGQADETLAGDYRVTYTMTQPPEVDTQLTADSYGGVDPYIAVHDDSFAPLPLEAGGSAEVVWTIGADGLLVADVPPRVTTLLSAGASTFEGGYERRDFGPIEQCDDTPNITTSLTTIVVDEVDGEIVGFTGTHVEGSYIADAGDCFNIRHTTVWEVSGERIGPPDQARIDEVRG